MNFYICNVVAMSCFYGEGSQSSFKRVVWNTQLLVHQIKNWKGIFHIYSMHGGYTELAPKSRRGEFARPQKRLATNQGGMGDFHRVPRRVLCLLAARMLSVANRANVLPPVGMKG